MVEVIEESADLDAEERYWHSQASPAKLAFQLKISLDGSKPPIWRRVLVADCTLDVLHHIVQIAMGWTNSHLHMFEYGDDRFSDPRFELDDDDYDETQVWLSQLAASGCKKLRYWYDFGDDWWHTIKFEKLLDPKPTDKFPICVKGVGLARRRIAEASGAITTFWMPFATRSTRAMRKWSTGPAKNSIPTISTSKKRTRH